MNRHRLARHDIPPRAVRRARKKRCPECNGRLVVERVGVPLEPQTIYVCRGHFAISEKKLAAIQEV